MKEGVQGFAQAALMGGTPCLLASKWIIPVKESIALVTLIYSFMAKSKGCSGKTYSTQLGDFNAYHAVSNDAGACVRLNQGEYPTVAKALQAAVIPALADKEAGFRSSF